MRGVSRGDAVVLVVGLLTCMVMVLAGELAPEVVHVARTLSVTFVGVGP